MNGPPSNFEGSPAWLHLLADVDREIDDRARFTAEGGPEAPSVVAWTRQVGEGDFESSDGAHPLSPYSLGRNGPRYRASANDQEADPVSADDNAPEQAREVEVVRGVLDRVNGRTLSQKAEAVLAALAPLRAAERQEAAREVLVEAAEAMRQGVDGYDPHRIGESAYEPSHANWLRDRADGVTGRSGT